MKRVPCIGGPLDGKRVTSAEMRPTVTARRDFASHKAGDVLSVGGVYGNVGDQYLAYNRQFGRGPSSIYLHKSLLETSLDSRR